VPGRQAAPGSDTGLLRRGVLAGGERGGQFGEVVGDDGVRVCVDVGGLGDVPAVTGGDGTPESVGGEPGGDQG